MAASPPWDRLIAAAKEREESAALGAEIAHLRWLRARVRVRRLEAAAMAPKDCWVAAEKDGAVKEAKHVYVSAYMDLYGVEPDDD